MLKNARSENYFGEEIYVFGFDSFDEALEKMDDDILQEKGMMDIADIDFELGRGFVVKHGKSWDYAIEEVQMG